MNAASGRAEPEQPDPVKPGRSVVAIVPAAGQSLRLGPAQPKQFMSIGRRMVLEHTLHALAADPHVSRAIVVLAEGSDTERQFDSGRLAVEIAPGGESRTESVLAGLRLARTGAAGQVVLVHDAARPFLDPADLAAVISAGFDDEHGAILARRVSDTIKRGTGRIETTVPRGRLWLAETPQVFLLEPLLHALEDAVEMGIAVTDEAAAMERLGYRPALIPARHPNLKLTYPADIEYARRVLI